MAVKIFGGKKVWDTKVVEGGQTDKLSMGECGTTCGGHDGLHKHMGQHSFSIGNHSGGAPKVAEAGWNNGMGGGPNSNANLKTSTNMGVGSKLRPTKGSNIYLSGDSIT